jgi:hypothetical protein
MHAIGGQSIHQYGEGLTTKPMSNKSCEMVNRATKRPSMLPGASSFDSDVMIDMVEKKVSTPKAIITSAHPDQN